MIPYGMILSIFVKKTQKRRKIVKSQNWMRFQEKEKIAEKKSIKKAQKSQNIKLKKKTRHVLWSAITYISFLK